MNNLKEAADLTSELIEQWGATMVPVKECIEFAVLTIGHANKDVRNNGMKIVCNLYKHMGSLIEPCIKEIKDSTLKIIREEFQKITPYSAGEFKLNKQLKGDGAEELAGKQKGGISLDDLVTR